MNAAGVIVCVLIGGAAASVAWLYAACRYFEKDLIARVQKWSDNE